MAVVRVERRMPKYVRIHTMMAVAIDKIHHGMFMPVPLCKKPDITNRGPTALEAEPLLLRPQGYQAA